MRLDYSASSLTMAFQNRWLKRMPKLALSMQKIQIFCWKFYPIYHLENIYTVELEWTPWLFKKLYNTGIGIQQLADVLFGKILDDYFFKLTQFLINALDAFLKQKY